MKITKKIEEMLKVAFFVGFDCSEQGFNAEKPFASKSKSPKDNKSMKAAFRVFMRRLSPKGKQK